MLSVHINTSVPKSVHLKDIQAKRVLTESCYPPPSPEFCYGLIWPLLSTVSSEIQGQGLRRFGIYQVNAR